MSFTDDLSDGFFRKVYVFCTRLQCKPEDMLKVWFSESIGIFADKQNQFGAAAYGINQISWGNLTGGTPGWTGTAADYMKLTAEQQLPYVEKCYVNYMGQLTSAARIYQLNYLADTFYKVTTPDGVIAGKDGPYAWAYKGNEWLDSYNAATRTGVITLTSMNRALDGAVTNPIIPTGRTMRLVDRWNEIVSRLGSAAAAPAAPPAPPLLLGQWAVTTPDGAFRYFFDMDGGVQWSYEYQANVFDETAGDWAVENGKLKITWKNSVEFWSLPLTTTGTDGESQRNDGSRGPTSAKKVPG
jgi:hypothetical protein